MNMDKFEEAFNKIWNEVSKELHEINRIEDQLSELYRRKREKEIQTRKEVETETIEVNGKIKPKYSNETARENETEIRLFTDKEYISLETEIRHLKHKKRELEEKIKTRFALLKYLGRTDVANDCE